MMRRAIRRGPVHSSDAPSARPARRKRKEEGLMAEPSDTPIVDLLGRMTVDSLEAATALDERTIMLVRIAALIAVDAPPASYVVNVGAAADDGLDADQLRS